MKPADNRRYCFCGQSVADKECIQIDLAMPSGAPEQSFGAHRDHLERLLHA